MFDRGSPWVGQHNWGSPQEPGQRYLRGARTVCLRDSIEHLAGDFARPQWKPRDESIFIALAIIHHVVPFAVGKAIAVLHGDDRDNSARSLDVLLRDVGQRDQATLFPSFRI